MAGAGALGWWSSSFGGLSPDGAFVLVEPWRIAGGDLPFRHEWHVSVFYGMFAAPALWVYRKLFGSEAGIFLIMNRLIVVVWFAALLTVWSRWRKVNVLGASLGALAIALYPPWGGFSFGYNKLGVITMMLAITFYATAGVRRNVDLLLAGVFFACAAMCCPYLAVFFAVYFIFAAVKRRKELLKVSAGCAIVAAIALTWLACKLSVADISEALPCMFDDPQHPRPSLFILIRNIVAHLLFITHDLAVGHAILMGGVLFAICAAWADARRGQRALMHLVLISAPVLGLYVYYRVQPMVSLNPLMLLLPMTAAWAAAFLNRGGDDAVMIKALLPGFAYVAAISFASNMGLYAMSLAAEAMMVPAVVVIAVVLGRLGGGFAAVLICLMTVHMAILAEYTIMKPLMRDPATVKIVQEGPNQGCKFSPSAAGTYAELYRDTAAIRGNDRVKNVLYLDHPNQWLYLASDKGVGAYSSWLTGPGTNSLNRLKRYWEINPDKLPEAVFVTKKNRYLENILCERYGYEVEPLLSGNSILWKHGVK